MQELSRPGKRVAGLNQVLRALAEGRAVKVYLAENADDHIRRNVHERCTAAGVPIQEVSSMVTLGRACALKVGTAVACILS